MIVEMKPMTMAEVKKAVGDVEENKELKDYLKKFSNVPEDKAKKLYEKLKSLGNLKLKDEFIVKIVDFSPKDREDLHKLFTDITLDEKETNDILEIVKGS